MLDVCLLGTSGMMPLPGRALTSLMMRFDGSSMLIDCGEGTQVSIREKGWSVHPIDTICITHMHGDHISGLPGLLLSMGNADRTEPITIIGPAGIARICECLMVIAPNLPFDIHYVELKEPTCDMEINGYTLHAFRVNHNVVCYGYSVTIPRAGKFDKEKAEINQVPLCLWNPLQKGNTVEYENQIFTPDMILGEERKGIKVTYCTDSRPTKRIVEAAEQSDLFICEGMYGEKGMEAKAREHRHMTFYEAAELAKEAKVAEMWLTHYSPSLICPEMYMKEVKKIFANAKPGKDRKSVELNFQD